MDEKVYMVVGARGYRGPWETHAAAIRRARRLRAMGWPAAVHYRDGRKVAVGGDR